MSSNSPQESIDPVNVAMLRDVLRAAGFRGVEAEASSDAKREALVFLNSEFRNGNRTRKALLLALEHRDTGLPPIHDLKVHRKTKPSIDGRMREVVSAPFLSELGTQL